LLFKDFVGSFLFFPTELNEVIRQHCHSSICLLNPAQQAEVIDAAERAAAEHRDMEAFVRWVDARVQEDNIAPLAIEAINNFWHHEICPCWQCGGDYGILYDA